MADILICITPYRCISPLSETEQLNPACHAEALEKTFTGEEARAYSKELMTKWASEK